MNNIKAKCSQGNPGVKLCSSPLCQTVGVICAGECECSNSHKNCLEITNINTLISHMQKKGEMITPLFGAISQWCEKYIKQFETFLFEIKNKISNPNENLRGKERKLFQYLKNGKSENIKGKLVNDVVQTLQSASSIYNYFQDQTIFFNETLQKISQQINVVFNQVKQLGKYQQYADGNAIYSISSKNGFISSSIIQNDNSILTNYTNICNVALLNSPVQMYQNMTQTYKFKIIKIEENYYVGLGLCHFSFALKQNFKGNISDNQGVYCATVTGDLYSHQGNQPERQANKIVSMEANDIIHLIFTCSNNPKLQISNVTKNQKDILYINLIKGDWLYFFISLKGPANSIQYLGLELS